MAKKATSGYKSDVLTNSAVAMKDLGIVIMSPREFSTGSVGFNHSGKANLLCGEGKYAFQVSLNVTMAHSKESDEKRIAEAIRDEFLASAPKDLKDLGLKGVYAAPHSFNSGKVGYHFNGKVTIDGQAFQVGCSITAIGSETWDDERPIERVAV